MESVQACTLRGQLELVKGENPIDITEVSTSTHTEVFSIATWP